MDTGNAAESYMAGSAERRSLETPFSTPADLARLALLASGGDPAAGALNYLDRSRSFESVEDVVRDLGDDLAEVHRPEAGDDAAAPELGVRAERHAPEAARQAGLAADGYAEETTSRIRSVVQEELAALECRLRETLEKSVAETRAEFAAGIGEARLESAERDDELAKVTATLPATLAERDSSWRQELEELNGRHKKELAGLQEELERLLALDGLKLEKLRSELEQHVQSVVDRQILASRTGEPDVLLPCTGAQPSAESDDSKGTGDFKQLRTAQQELERTVQDLQSALSALSPRADELQDMRKGLQGLQRSFSGLEVELGRQPRAEELDQVRLVQQELQRAVLALQEQPKPTAWLQRVEEDLKTALTEIQQIAASASPPGMEEQVAKIPQVQQDLQKHMDMMVSLLRQQEILCQSVPLWEQKMEEVSLLRKSQDVIFERFRDFDTQLEATRVLGQARSPAASSPTAASPGAESPAAASACENEDSSINDISNLLLPREDLSLPEGQAAETRFSAVVGELLSRQELRRLREDSVAELLRSLRKADDSATEAADAAAEAEAAAEAAAAAAEGQAVDAASTNAAAAVMTSPPRAACKVRQALESLAGELPGKLGVLLARMEIDVDANVVEDLQEAMLAEILDAAVAAAAARQGQLDRSSGDAGLGEQQPPPRAAPAAVVAVTAEMLRSDCEKARPSTSAGQQVAAASFSCLQEAPLEEALRGMQSRSDTLEKVVREEQAVLRQTLSEVVVRLEQQGSAQEDAARAAKLGEQAYAEALKALEENLRRLRMEELPGLREAILEQRGTGTGAGVAGELERPAIDQGAACDVAEIKRAVEALEVQHRELREHELGRFQESLRRECQSTFATTVSSLQQQTQTLDAFSSELRRLRDIDLPELREDCRKCATTEAERTASATTSALQKSMDAMEARFQQLRSWNLDALDARIEYLREGGELKDLVQAIVMQQGCSLSEDERATIGEVRALAQSVEALERRLAALPAPLAEDERAAIKDVTTLNQRVEGLGLQLAAMQPATLTRDERAELAETKSLRHRIDAVESRFAALPGEMEELRRAAQSEQSNLAAWRASLEASRQKEQMEVAAALSAWRQEAGALEQQVALSKSKVAEALESMIGRLHEYIDKEAAEALEKRVLRHVNDSVAAMKEHLAESTTAHLKPLHEHVVEVERNLQEDAYSVAEHIEAIKLRTDELERSCSLKDSALAEELKFLGQEMTRVTERLFDNVSSLEGRLQASSPSSGAGASGSFASTIDFHHKVETLRQQLAEVKGGVSSSLSSLEEWFAKTVVSELSTLKETDETLKKRLEELAKEMTVVAAKQLAEEVKTRSGMTDLLISVEEQLSGSLDRDGQEMAVRQLGERVESLEQSLGGCLDDEFGKRLREEMMQLEGKVMDAMMTSGRATRETDEKTARLLQRVEAEGAIFSERAGRLEEDVAAKMRHADSQLASRLDEEPQLVLRQLEERLKAVEHPQNQQMTSQLLDELVMSQSELREETQKQLGELDIRVRSELKDARREHSLSQAEALAAAVAARYSEKLALRSVAAVLDGNISELRRRLQLEGSKTLDEMHQLSQRTHNLDERLRAAELASHAQASVSSHEFDQKLQDMELAAQAKASATQQHSERAIEALNMKQRACAEAIVQLKGQLLEEMRTTQSRTVDDAKLLRVQIEQHVQEAASVLVDVRECAKHVESEVEASRSEQAQADAVEEKEATKNDRLNASAEDLTRLHGDLVELLASGEARLAGRIGDATAELRSELASCAEEASSEWQSREAALADRLQTVEGLLRGTLEEETARLSERLDAAVTQEDLQLIVRQVADFKLELELQSTGCSDAIATVQSSMAALQDGAMVHSRGVDEKVAALQQALTALRQAMPEELASELASRGAEQSVISRTFEDRLAAVDLQAEHLQKSSAAESEELQVEMKSVRMESQRLGATEF
eukprot:TRINITY_DN38243_c0_g1_i3.p1 TRINITY_DN38243_c0_g1~~TRINITY_DN38243_c0_g1_i3.p1  ORF type:complete len:1954 (+),score=671.36 TRINITY_DN38243_c0_g1_i3:99-5960(+)